jgi:hypothetical protein
MLRIRRIVFAMCVVIAVLATSALLLALVFRSDLGGPDFIFITAAGLGYLVGLVFAAAPALERPNLRWLAGAGILVALLMTVAFPAYMVADSTLFRAYSYTYEPEMGSLIGTGMTVAGMLCLMSLALLPRLRWPGRLLQTGTATTMFAAGGMIVVGIWVPWEFQRDMERALESALILSGGGFLGTWAFACRQRIKLPDPLCSIDLFLHARCPRCATEQELAAGESHCRACGLWFRIHFEEPRCPACGYNLRALTHPQCPECGKPIVPEQLGASGRAEPVPTAVSSLATSRTAG